MSIEQIEATRIHVPITGKTPLITNRFSSKAKQQMLDNMQGKKSQKKNKDPEAEYEAAKYRLGDGYGFPALAFKQATVAGARFYSGTTMTSLRQALFFHGERSEDGDLLIPITHEEEPIMREDVVRVGRGTDLRYRPEFENWGATLDITFVPSVVDQDSVLALINAGGLGCGVGEWRPEKSGMHGQFQVGGDVEVVG